MPDVSVLLVLVIALATGLIASIAVANHMQTVGGDFYRGYLTNILLFNLLILSGMVWAFLGQATAGFGQPSFLIMMAMLKLGWLGSFADVLYRLQGSGRETLNQNRIFWMGGVFAAYAVLIVLGWIKNLSGLLLTINIGMELFIIGGALVLATRGVLQVRLISPGALRSAKLQFTLFHATLMTLILFFQVYSWLPLALPGAWQVPVSGGLLLLFNIFPLLWIGRYRPSAHAGLTEKFEGYGVTARERQIVELIQLGKTNQDIADQLFISLATVKDHNNRIFRKCGVRNRTELAKLFSDV